MGYTWVGGPELYKKSEKQASEQHTSMTAASVPVPRFLTWFPALLPISDEVWPESCKLKEPFLSQVLFAHQSNRNPNYDGYFSNNTAFKPTELKKTPEDERKEIHTP